MIVTITTDGAPNDIIVSCDTPDIISEVSTLPVVVTVELFRDGQDGEDAINYNRKHDFVTATSYNGYAPVGSLESDLVWNITKLAIAPNGTTTGTTASNVSWTNRLTNIYT